MGFPWPPEAVVQTTRSDTEAEGTLLSKPTSFYPRWVLGQDFTPHLKPVPPNDLW